MIRGLPGLVPVLLLTALVCRADTVSTCTIGDTICVSTSVGEVDTTVDNPVTQTADQYSTEIIGMMQGGPVLYDQTFSAAFSSAAVQSAVLNAEDLLTLAGAVSFSGPTLENNTQAFMGSTTDTTQTGDQTTNVATLTRTWIGPLTIYIGNLGICESYNASDEPPVSGCSLTGTQLPIGPGDEDIDTFITSFVTITDTVTTTNTYEISQVYDIEGLPASAVPEPGTLGLMIAAGAACVLKRRFS